MLLWQRAGLRSSQVNSRRIKAFLHSAKPFTCIKETWFILHAAEGEERWLFARCSPACLPTGRRNLSGGWSAGGSSARGGLCHGAGLAGQRSLEGGAQAACSERRPWKRSRQKREPVRELPTTLEAARTFPSEKTGVVAMAGANGRRNGAGDPEPWPARDGQGVGVGSPGMDAGCRSLWMGGGNTEGRRVAQQAGPGADGS